MKKALSLILVFALAISMSGCLIDIGGLFPTPGDYTPGATPGDISNETPGESPTATPGGVPKKEDETWYTNDYTLVYNWNVNAVDGSDDYVHLMTLMKNDEGILLMDKQPNNTINRNIVRKENGRYVKYLLYEADLFGVRMECGTGVTLSELSREYLVWDDVTKIDLEQYTNEGPCVIGNRNCTKYTLRSVNADGKTFGFDVSVDDEFSFVAEYSYYFENDEGVGEAYPLVSVVSLSFDEVTAEDIDYNFRSYTIN